MKKDKIKLIILTVLALAFAAGTFFVLLYSTNIYHFFGKFTIGVFVLFPVCDAVIAIIATTVIFKTGKISYITSVIAALVGCILAFILVNDASLNKIGSDFLRHELTFNNAVKTVSSKEGVYTFDCAELKGVLPEQKVQVVAIDAVHNAILFVALDLPDRTEGYAYVPYGEPIEWDDFGEWSDALDINGHWYYLYLIK